MACTAPTAISRSRGRALSVRVGCSILPSVTSRPCGRTRGFNNISSEESDGPWENYEAASYLNRRRDGGGLYRREGPPDRLRRGYGGQEGGHYLRNADHAGGRQLACAI